MCRSSFITTAWAVVKAARSIRRAWPDDELLRVAGRAGGGQRGHGHRPQDHRPQGQEAFARIGIYFSQVNPIEG
jgi:hypothetical protein